MKEERDKVESGIMSEPTRMCKFEVCVEVKGLSLFGRETMVIGIETPAEGDPNERARNLLACIRNTVLDWETLNRKEGNHED